jgi:hypothetical protein
MSQELEKSESATKFISSTSTSPIQIFFSESHVVATAQQLTTALKGNIPAGNETAKELTKLSNIFNRIAPAKAEVAALQAQQEIERRTIRLYPEPTTTTTSYIGRSSSKGDSSNPNDKRSSSKRAQSSSNGPTTTSNYITQDDKEDSDQQQQYNTRSQCRANQVIEVSNLLINIAMMISKIPTNNQQVRTGVSWLGEMANSVIGKDGSILEYKHLIAIPKTRETWLRSCGNKFGQLAQGMSGQVEGTNTIFFIQKIQHTS